MSLVVRHECTRVPVTALAASGPLLLAAEGPYLRFYHGPDFQYLATRRIFEAQAIHGISVQSKDCHSNLVFWGACLIRVLQIDHVSLNSTAVSFLDHVRVSNVVKAPDWILDLRLSSVPFQDLTKSTAAAITAHNALLELAIRRADDQSLLISISELTSSSRSILYSANLQWESLDHILVAAGTAFGEIIYWSWTRNSGTDSGSLVHKVFLGHEGSIFGVCLSHELKDPAIGTRTRLLASCSDDRTVRIWDISNFADNENAITISEDSRRSRHTGFSSTSYDEDLESSLCAAIGWGHMSRVWSVQFLASRQEGSVVSLISSGEDATSRVWVLKPMTKIEDSNSNITTFDIRLATTTTHHTGKNIWSTTVHGPPLRFRQVVCGAADSKITAYALPSCSQTSEEMKAVVPEYTVPDIAALERPFPTDVTSQPVVSAHKSSKLSEFFRGYAFMDSASLLLTTNAGKVYIGILAPPSTNSASAISRSRLLVQVDDLQGYSICVAERSLGIAFVAGSRGSIYSYRLGSSTLNKIHTLQGKIGSMFTVRTSGISTIGLLVTQMGQKEARLLDIDCSATQGFVRKIVAVPISESQTGSVITSMAYIVNAAQTNYILLGFRGGSIAIYAHPVEGSSYLDSGETDANVICVINMAHSKEAVTALHWVPRDSQHFSIPASSAGHLISVGRDSRIAVHSIDPVVPSVQLVHNLLLPIGPNIEGLFYHDDCLLVYGFSSSKFVLYDTVAEREIMSVETGGSHRSWAFCPHSSHSDGGILVWTRASSMHIYNQDRPSHKIIQSGLHGREIKAVTVSRSCVSGKQLVATGAEDTDIKIFEYVDGDFVCRRTLRRHTTGLQHMQWSDNGEYLFSSGGCEEFYIWRVRSLSSAMGIAIVCESVYAPESEHSDLRIMAFDVRQFPITQGFIIAMVFSDSNIKVYNYNPTASTKWRKLANGTYTTSCLTQCTMLSSNMILTTGTDGHAVLWPLSLAHDHHNASTSGHPYEMAWENPARIHQNTSKTLAARKLNDTTTLVVSGGDDGSLSFLMTAQCEALRVVHASSPIVVTRAHASAITACAILFHREMVFIVTSGNDQWIRIWEATLTPTSAASHVQYSLKIRRVKKLKTNVADVSGMALLDETEEVTKVVICGVGMEVVCVEWSLSALFRNSTRKQE